MEPSIRQRSLPLQSISQSKLQVVEAARATIESAKLVHERAQKMMLLLRAVMHTLNLTWRAASDAAESAQVWKSRVQKLERELQQYKARVSSTHFVSKDDHEVVRPTTSKFIAVNNAFSQGIVCYNASLDSAHRIEACFSPSSPSPLTDGPTESDSSDDEIILISI